MEGPRPRLLFVDDEPRVLAGLTRLVARLAPELEVLGATSAEVALVMVRAQPIDLVVSDLRMPRTDGIDLCRDLAASQPGAGRMVLSGTAELDAAVGALAVAHQFLCKPADGAELVARCRRILAVRGRLDAAELAAVGGVTALPVSPSAIAALRRASAQAAATDAACRVVAREPTLVAAVLHAASSQFLGGTTPLTSLREILGAMGPAWLEALMDDPRTLVPASGADLARLEEVASRAERRRADLAGAEPPAEIAAALVELDVAIGLSPPGAGRPALAAGLLGLWGVPEPICDRLALQDSYGSSRAISATRADQM